MHQIAADQFNKDMREFKQLDKNGDGKITRTEILLFFKNPSPAYQMLAKEIIIVNDRNGDGVLDFDEFQLVDEKPKCVGDECLKEEVVVDDFVLEYAYTYEEVEEEPVLPDDGV